MATAARSVTHAAVGLVETRGLIGAIEAADVAVKTAGVELLPFKEVGGGLVTARFRGDIAAVQTAVQHAAAAASRLTEVVAQSVITAPAAEVGGLLVPEDAPSAPLAGRGTSPSPEQVPAPGTPLDPVAELDPASLSSMPVAALRRLARQLPGMRLKGREVSRAGRDLLLAELDRLRRDVAT